MAIRLFSKRKKSKTPAEPAPKAKSKRSARATAVQTGGSKVSRNKEQQMFLMAGGVIMALILVVLGINTAWSPSQGMGGDEMNTQKVVRLSERTVKGGSQDWVAKLAPAPVFGRGGQTPRTPTPPKSVEPLPRDAMELPSAVGRWSRDGRSGTEVADRRVKSNRHNGGLNGGQNGRYSDHSGGASSRDARNENRGPAGEDGFGRGDAWNDSPQRMASNVETRRGGSLPAPQALPRRSQRNRQGGSPRDDYARMAQSGMNDAFPIPSDVRRGDTGSRRNIDRTPGRAPAASRRSSDYADARNTDNRNGRDRWNDGYAQAASPRATTAPRRVASNDSRQVTPRSTSEYGSRTASTRSGRSVADFLPALSQQRPAARKPAAASSRRASSSHKPQHYAGSLQVTSRAPLAASGAYSVQLGSFSSAQNAQGVRDRMAMLTFGSGRMPASSVPVDVRGRTYHRVRLGPFKTRWEANKAASIAEEHGLSGKLIKH